MGLGKALPEKYITIYESYKRLKSRVKK